jgi:hypothetical protein
LEFEEASPANACFNERMVAGTVDTGELLPVNSGIKFAAKVDGVGSQLLIATVKEIIRMDFLAPGCLYEPVGGLVALMCSPCSFRTSGRIPISRVGTPPKTGQIVCYQDRTYHLSPTTCPTAQLSVSTLMATMRPNGDRNPGEAVLVHPSGYE